MGKKKLWHRAFGIALGAGMLSLTSCAFFPSRLPWQAYHDRETTTKVTEALGSQRVLRYPNVNISTFDYVVRLSGYVKTPEDKEHLVTTVRKVPGVRDVMDYTRVATEPVEKNIETLPPAGT